MQQRGRVQRGTAAWQTWLGGALAVLLLLAESFALTHELDTAAHDNGQACAVCVGAASLGAAAVAAPVHFEPPRSVAAAAAAVFAVLPSVAPTREFARGPPAVSF
jgi:hypothetical protein